MSKKPQARKPASLDDRRAELLDALKRAKDSVANVDRTISGHQRALAMAMGSVAKYKAESLSVADVVKRSMARRDQVACEASAKREQACIERESRDRARYVADIKRISAKLAALCAEEPLQALTLDDVIAAIRGWRAARLDFKRSASVAHWRNHSFGSRTIQDLDPSEYAEVIRIFSTP